MNEPQNLSQIERQNLLQLWNSVCRQNDRAVNKQERRLCPKLGHKLKQNRRRELCRNLTSINLHPIITLSQIWRIEDKILPQLKTKKEFGIVSPI